MKDVIDKTKDGEDLLNKVLESLQNYSIPTCVGVLVHVLASTSVAYKVEPSKVINEFIRNIRLLKQEEEYCPEDIINLDNKTIH